MARCLSVYVAMPFDESFDDVYVLGIRAVAKEAPGWDIHVFRADTVPPNAFLLHANILSLIESADVVVADITGCNPNVLYEIGIAHAFHRHIILVTEDEGTIPTNLRGHIFVAYSSGNLSKLGRDLGTRLVGVLPQLLKTRTKIGTRTGGRSYLREVEDPPRPVIPREAVEQRDLGEAAKRRGETERALSYFRKAIELYPGYWEAKYDLALALSLTKHEEEALEIIEKVMIEAHSAGDKLHVCRSHNLKSGIHKRKGDYQRALEEIRAAYEIAHSPQMMTNGHALIVPTKNRLVLELLVGDKAAAQQLKDELLKHPRVDEIRGDLENEIGGFE